jgi:hypothetical protein
MVNIPWCFGHGIVENVRLYLGCMHAWTTTFHGPTITVLVQFWPSWNSNRFLNPSQIWSFLIPPKIEIAQHKSLLAQRIESFLHRSSMYWTLLCACRYYISWSWAPGTYWVVADATKIVGGWRKGGWLVAPLWKWLEVFLANSMFVFNVQCLRYCMME